MQDAPIIHFEDLLPPLCHRIVESRTGKRLWPTQSNAILVTLVNCLQNSILREAACQHEKDPTPITTFTTSDHFANSRMSRAEIVGDIAAAAGLNNEIADFSLLLIEMRIDLALAAAEVVSVEHLGVFNAYRDDPVHHGEPARSYFSPEFEHITNLLREDTGGLADVVRSWFGNNSSRRLKVLYDTLEILPMFRRLMRYRIDLVDELRYRPGPFAGENIVRL